MVEPPRKKLKSDNVIIVEDESDSSTDSFESDVSMETLRNRLNAGKIRERLINESTDDSSSDDDPSDEQPESDNKRNSELQAALSTGLQHLVDSIESKHKIRDSTLTTLSSTCIKKERETNEQSLSSIQVKQEILDLGKNEKNTPDLRVRPCYVKIKPQDTVQRHGDQFFANQGRQNEAGGAKMCEETDGNLISSTAHSVSKRPENQEREENRTKPTEKLKIFVRPKVMKKTRKVDELMKLCVAGCGITEKKLSNMFPDSTHISIQENKNCAYVSFNNKRKCKAALEKYQNKPPYIVREGGTITYTETYVHPLRLVVFGIDRTLTKKKLKEMFPDAKRISISETEKTLRTGCCAFLRFTDEKKCRDVLERYGEKFSPDQSEVQEEGETPTNSRSVTNENNRATTMPIRHDATDHFVENQSVPGLPDVLMHISSSNGSSKTTLPAEHTDTENKNMKINSSVMKQYDAKGYYGEKALLPKTVTSTCDVVEHTERSASSPTELKRLSILKKQGVDVCLLDLLHVAVEHNNVSAAVYLIQNGADVNAKDKNGYTILCNVCSYGDDEMVKLLLKYGASVNTDKSSSSTPLHEAAARGKVATCELLLKHGADPGRKNSSGLTPLDIVLSGPHSHRTKLVDLLKSSESISIDLVQKGSVQELPKSSPSKQQTSKGTVKELPKSSPSKQQTSKGTVQDLPKSSPSKQQTSKGTVQELPKSSPSKPQTSKRTVQDLPKCSPSEQQTSKGTVQDLPKYSPKKQQTSKGTVQELPKYSPSKQQTSKGNVQELPKCSPSKPQTSKGTVQDLPKCSPSEQQTSKGTVQELPKSSPSEQQTSKGTVQELPKSSPSKPQTSKRTVQDLPKCSPSEQQTSKGTVQELPKSSPSKSQTSKRTVQDLPKCSPSEQQTSKGTVQELPKYSPSKQKSSKIVEFEPCEANYNTMEHKEACLNGKLHGKRMKIFAADQTKYTSKGSSSTRVLRSADKKPKASKIIKCELCKKKLTSRKNEQEHLKGKKHAKMMRAARRYLNSQKKAHRTNTTGKRPKHQSTENAKDEARILIEEYKTTLSTTYSAPTSLPRPWCTLDTKTSKQTATDTEDHKVGFRADVRNTAPIPNDASWIRIGKRNSGDIVAEATKGQDIDRSQRRCCIVSPMKQSVPTKEQNNISVSLESSHKTETLSEQEWTESLEVLTKAKIPDVGVKERPVFSWPVKQLKTQDCRFVQDNSVSSSSVEIEPEQSVNNHSKEMDTGSCNQITDCEENSMKPATHLPEKQVTGDEKSKVRKRRQKLKDFKCPCGSKKMCKIWKKSKKVFNPKKLMVQGFKMGTRQEDVWNMFPRAVDVQMRLEKISSNPHAVVLYQDENDCERALKKYKRNFSLSVKLGQASQDELKNGTGICLHDLKMKKARRKKRK